MNENKINEGNNDKQYGSRIKEGASSYMVAARPKHFVLHLADGKEHATAAKKGGSNNSLATVVRSPVFGSEYVTGTEANQS